MGTQLSLWLSQILRVGLQGSASAKVATATSMVFGERVVNKANCAPQVPQK
jgi:hypothetical protein